MLPSSTDFSLPLLLPLMRSDIKENNKREREQVIKVKDLSTRAYGVSSSAAAVAAHTMMLVNSSNCGT
jgi:hypothetical protein